MKRKLLNVQEASEILDCHPDTLRRMIRDRKFTTCIKFRRLYVYKDEIEKFIQDRIIPKARGVTF